MNPAPVVESKILFLINLFSFFSTQNNPEDPLGLEITDPYCNLQVIFQKAL